MSVVGWLDAIEARTEAAARDGEYAWGDEAIATTRRLVSVIREILAAHVPETSRVQKVGRALASGGFSVGNEHCRECDRVWPCATVRAIVEGTE